MTLPEALRALNEAAYAAAKAAAKSDDESAAVLRRIAAERQRQIEEEGFGPEHDSGNLHGEMARAAACYILWGGCNPNGAVQPLPGAIPELLVPGWPWSEKWWKPIGPIRDLEKAGALIAAEIDRRLRLTGQ